LSRCVWVGLQGGTARSRNRVQLGDHLITICNVARRKHPKGGRNRFPLANRRPSSGKRSSELLSRPVSSSQFRRVSFAPMLYTRSADHCQSGYGRKFLHRQREFFIGTGLGGKKVAGRDGKAERTALHGHGHFPVLLRMRDKRSECRTIKSLKFQLSFFLIPCGDAAPEPETLTIARVSQQKIKEASCRPSKNVIRISLLPDPMPK